jgi:hypothetical protein
LAEFTRDAVALESIKRAVEASGHVAIKVVLPKAA